jgi:hypothetical protein
MKGIINNFKNSRSPKMMTDMAKEDDNQTPLSASFE